MKYLLLSLCVFFLTCISCARVNEYFGLKDDNLIESCIEYVIQSKVGINFDLTPQNPDDDDYSLNIWKTD